MAGSEKTRPAPMVFGGSSNRVTSSVHRGRRMHSPFSPSSLDFFALVHGFSFFEAMSRYHECT